MRTLFFTVATTNYLPFAVSLLDSVKLHHPEFEFCICLTDYLNADDMERYSLAKKYPLLQLHEIKAEEFDFITKNYNPSELSNACKIPFAQHFFKNNEVDQVIFGDSDMLFFNRLPDHIFKEHEIIFTPHFTSPPPHEHKSQEMEVLNAGMFNGGFFKLSRSEETFRFLDWFRSRCTLECISDRCRGIYYDQLWINFVPLYFQTTHIERDKGMNMAYWNLHERSITKTEIGFIVNQSDILSFFHFSGWDFNHPLKVCKWASWDAESRPDLKPLLLKYYEMLKANQYEQYISIPNYYTAKNNSGKKSLFKKLKRKLFRKQAK
jgi:hypothetical protein